MGNNIWSKMIQAPICAVEMLTIALIHLRTFLQEEIHHGRMAKASLRARPSCDASGWFNPIDFGTQSHTKKSGMFFLSVPILE